MNASHLFVPGLLITSLVLSGCAGFSEAVAEMSRNVDDYRAMQEGRTPPSVLAKQAEEREERRQQQEVDSTASHERWLSALQETPRSDTANIEWLSEHTVPTQTRIGTLAFDFTDEGMTFLIGNVPLEEAGRIIRWNVIKAVGITYTGRVYCGYTLPNGMEVFQYVTPDATTSAEQVAARIYRLVASARGSPPFKTWMLKDADEP